MPQPKKGVADFIAKKVAKGAGKRLEKSATKSMNKSAKKEAGKTLKKAGKAGSPLTSKVTVGPKTRKKMAEGKFGSKVKQGPASKQKSSSTGNVKVKNQTERDPFAFFNDPEKRKAAQKAAEARRKKTRASGPDEFYAVK